MPPADKPFHQFQQKTLFLRIPTTDWARVLAGEKREFREAGRYGPRWGVMAHKLPIPIVGYRYRSFGGAPESTMLVLERTWSEPLGAISKASLEAEGFADIGEFRRYWKARHPRRGFRPLSITQVYGVRPFTEDDRAAMGARLLELLYGEFL